MQTRREMLMGAAWAGGALALLGPGALAQRALAGGAVGGVDLTIRRPAPGRRTLSSAAVPGVSLTYTTLEQITDDIDDARVYGVIHFRFDQEGGAKLGVRIGRYVYDHSLQPARSSNSAVDSGR